MAGRGAGRSGDSAAVLVWWPPRVSIRQSHEATPRSSACVGTDIHTIHLKPAALCSSQQSPINGRGKRRTRDVKMLCRQVLGGCLWEGAASSGKA